MITVVAVPFEDERAQALWEAQQDEVEAMYGRPDVRTALHAEGVIVSLLALGSEGEPVGTVMAKWSQYHPDRPGAAEIKRLYVAPEHRGHRHARVLMGALERATWRAGATELVLQTGALQPEAIAVYRGIGYRDTAGFGAYAGEPDSVCLSKHLPTRVLVINGTIGAGKTSTAAAVHDVLAEEGARSAFIDADYLCQATPLPEDDAYGQALLFENLAAVSPVYRARGYGCIVLARVVEDARDRDRYAAAFSGPGGRAHVSIVRVTASQDARVSRISAREPEGYWRELCLARTVELDDALEDLDLDDGVVSSEGATRIDVAKAALDAAGW
jgi:GNAT superfamily N-acetyltransferase